jgi:hypothetical protein
MKIFKIILIIPFILSVISISAQICNDHSSATGCFANDVSGDKNTAYGCYSLNALTVSIGNSAYGDSSLYLLNGTALTGQGNVGIGNSALKNNVTGSSNTAVGAQALYMNTASGNTAVGLQSMYGNSTGSSNTAIGKNSMLSNTTGTQNDAHGNSALLDNTTGGSNVAIAYQALEDNTTGSDNTAIGVQALLTNTTGTGSTAVGFKALNLNSSNLPNDAFGYEALMNSVGAQNNAAFGYEAMLSTTTGSYNAAFGYQALQANTTASPVNAFGYQALYGNTTSNWNDAFGYQALYTNTNGTGENDAFGYQALFNNTSGDGNCGFGYHALYTCSTGTVNAAFGIEALYSLTNATGVAALGEHAGYSSTTGYDDTYLGSAAGTNNTTAFNSTFLGSSAGPGTPASNTVYLGNTSVTTIVGEVTTITAYSDARIKDNVKENVPGLSFITQLRPVTYNLNVERENEILYKGKIAPKLKDGMNEIDKIQQTGFIAQDVEKAAEKVGYNFSGVYKPKSEDDLYGLKYSDFVVPLVKAVQEQQSMIETQTETIKTMQQTLAQQQDAMTTVLNQLQEMKDCCSGGNTNGTPSQLITPQLFNAVPNPTAGSSVIYYFVPQTSKSVKIQLTDANGTIVQTINASNFGYSSTTVQIGNLAGGLYQYSLIVDDHLVDTKKLSVVLK